MVIAISIKLLIGYARTPAYLLELTLVLSVGYILLNMLYISFACVSKFFVWLSQGQSPSIFMFFPVIIQMYPKFKIILSFNPLNYLEEYYPAKWMNSLNSSDSLKQLEEKYKKTLTSGILTKVILSIIGVIVCLLLRQYDLIIFFILFAYAMYEMDKLQLQSIHGDLTKLKYVKNGFGYFYFAEKAILYDKSLYLYEEFQKHLLNMYTEHPELQYKSIKIIQHIYLLNILNKSVPESKGLTELISKEVLDDDAVYLASKVGQEQLDLLKVLLCYSMINNDDLLSRVNQKMMQLSTDWHGTIQNRISWYVQIGRHRTIPKQTTFIKNTVIRRSMRLTYFTNYDKIVKNIEDKMHEICKIG